MSEPLRILRLSLIGIIGRIAEVDVNGDINAGCDWPEIFQLISNNLTDPAHANNALLRELSFLLLSEMTDTVGNKMKSLFAPLSGMYMGVLSDQTRNSAEDNKVKSAALTSLGQVSERSERSELLLITTTNNTTTTTTNNNN